MIEIVIEKAVVIAVIAASVGFGNGYLCGQKREHNRWIRGEESDPESARRLALLASAAERAVEDSNHRDVPGGASRV